MKLYGSYYVLSTFNNFFYFIIFFSLLSTPPHFFFLSQQPRSVQQPTTNEFKIASITQQSKATSFNGGRGGERRA
jgi:hypothetical protein